MHKAVPSPLLLHGAVPTAIGSLLCWAATQRKMQRPHSRGSSLAFRVMSFVELLLPPANAPSALQAELHSRVLGTCCRPSWLLANTAPPTLLVLFCRRWQTG